MLLSLAGALTLAACGLLPSSATEQDAGPVPPPRPVAVHPDSLLTRLTPGTLDYVFAPGRATADDAPAWPAWLASGATLSYALAELGTDGRTVGRYRALAGRRPTEATGSLADTAGVQPAVPESPLPLVLPAEPPFADPRVRDRYTRRLVSTTWPRAAAAEAVLRTDAGGAADGVQAVHRAVVVVDTTTGRVLAAEVWRRSRSLLYDEQAHARIAIGTAPDGRPMPRLIRLETRVDTPGAPPRRYVQAWTASARP